MQLEVKCIMVYILIKDKFSETGTLKFLKNLLIFAVAMDYMTFTEHVLEYLLLIKLLLFDSFTC